MAENPFKVELKSLKSRPKADSVVAEKAADAVGVALGFASREPGRRGRLPSPRTGQVHAKVMPDVADAIGNEARRRGVQQGVIIEEAWAAYCAKQGT